ncbi:MAG: hypothetical protein ACLTYB_09115 [Clostridium paraputrificum]
MLDSVPPAVSKSFNLLIPTFTLTIFGLISFLTIKFTGIDGLCNYN